jgi:type II secretory ATPase GspE/PulE/Tfp pilus assembly ATPase PilB-like protein
MVSSEIDELQEILRLQQALEDITNKINATKSVRQILFNISDSGILNLFQAEDVTVYSIDKVRNDFYAVIKSGSALHEVRRPISNKSVPGCIANNRMIVNIANYDDTIALKTVHKELAPDPEWDKKSGIKVKQVLAAPIIYENDLLGIVQLTNKKGPAGKFDDSEQVLLQEIADALAVAFFEKQKSVAITPVVTTRTKKKKHDFLIENKLITQDQLNDANNEAHKNKEPLEVFLMRKHNIAKDVIGKSLAEFFQCNFITFNDKLPIPGDLLKNLKKEYLTRELWVPIEKINNKIHVIIDNPTNVLKRDAIENLLKTRAVVYDVALPDDILTFVDVFYTGERLESSISDIIGKMEFEEVQEGEEDDVKKVKETDSAIIQLVNKLVNEALVRGASDIHIEPDVTGKVVSVRYRIDGSCALYQTLPFSYRAAIVSRVKIMSNLDITEKRKPQDGKIKMKTSNRGEIELRVATIPTQGGVEDIVMRVLAKSQTLPLEAMGMTERNYKELIKISENPYGIILVVGPTGSGKTTTLHAILGHINTPDRKIWTAEDPVEVTQRGLRQVQVHPKIGFDFAAAMRAFLRADPDVIMVGEMRDFETAKTGVEASLTGHLVFSTLHTNSASETVTRLLDMGIDPMNFSDSMLGILAQRLVRTLCKACKEPYTPSRDEYEDMAEAYGRNYFEKLNIPYKDMVLYRPKGCETCGKTGYKGRVGVHELLVSTDNIKRAIQKRAAVETLRELAMSEGMTTLLQDGILKSIQGITDVKQVRRVCMK